MDLLSIKELKELTGRWEEIAASLADSAAIMSRVSLEMAEHVQTNLQAAREMGDAGNRFRNATREIPSYIRTGP